jgi:4-amino-4-deoxy-L-arabinose transferase-like glycosyltransferase
LAAWLSFVLLVVVFFGAIRYRLRDMPLERDEGEYAYAGQLMLEGIPPYALAYNMKLPGIYAAYAGVMALFGQTPAGIHLGLLVVNGVTTILLFFLAASLFGQRSGAVAATSYALLSTSASAMGFEAHATNFVVLPALLGTLLLLRALTSKRWWLFLFSGLFFGIALLMKQHGIFFVLFGIVYLGWSEWKPKSALLREEALLISGAVLPYLATCWLMWRAGVFRQFWFWTVQYAGEYSKMGLRRAVHAFLENSRIVIGPAWPIWILAGIGLTALSWNPEARRRSRFLISFLVCSFLALCPGAYFRPHYYILLLPAIAMLAGVAVSAATDRFAKAGLVLAPVIVFLLCLGYSVLQQRQPYFVLTPDDVVRQIYGNNAFIPAVKVADYVREHSPKDARIAVLGSEPEIYFYARRHSATGYLYMYSLIVHQKYTARMRDEMMQELETNRPLYVVFVDVWDDWGGREGGPELAEFLPRLHEFMDRSYDVVGVADIGENAQYAWDGAAQAYRPQSSKAIYVLRRKQGS